MFGPDPSQTLITCTIAAWVLVISGGAIFARRDPVYGLITAVLAVPGVIIAIGLAFAAFVMVQALLLALGIESASSDSAQVVRAIFAHAFGLFGWIWWVRGARGTTGAKWGPGMPTDQSRRERVNFFIKRRW